MSGTFLLGKGMKEEIELSMGEEFQLKKAQYAVKVMTRTQLEEFAISSLHLALIRQAAIRWLAGEGHSASQSGNGQPRDWTR